MPAWIRGLIWISGRDIQRDTIQVMLDASYLDVCRWLYPDDKGYTFLPWDSWNQPYRRHQPSIWFHEVFRTDGTPYKSEETELIKQMTGKNKAKAAQVEYKGTPHVVEATPLSPWSLATDGAVSLLP